MTITYNVEIIENLVDLRGTTTSGSTVFVKLFGAPTEDNIKRAEAFKSELLDERKLKITVPAVRAAIALTRESDSFNEALYATLKALRPRACSTENKYPGYGSFFSAREIQTVHGLLNRRFNAHYKEQRI